MEYRAGPLHVRDVVRPISSTLSSISVFFFFATVMVFFMASILGLTF